MLAHPEGVELAQKMQTLITGFENIVSVITEVKVAVNYSAKIFKVVYYLNIVSINCEGLHRVPFINDQFLCFCYVDL